MTQLDQGAQDVFKSVELQLKKIENDYEMTKYDCKELYGGAINLYGHYQNLQKQA